MGINDIIIFIVAGFVILGAIDKLLGNKLGYGEHFTDGFKAMAPLTLSMVGIISLAPVIASLLTPIISPIYRLIGADPSAFANTILAIDMGGYSLAQQMADTPEAALFSWVFLGTLMGPTFVFTIPVALGIIEKEDRQFFAKGILLGLVTVPIGAVVGGLIGGFHFDMIIINLLPTFIFSILIVIGLWKIPNKMIVGFSYFGRLIEIIAIVGLTAIIFETLTGIVIIPNMAPINEGILIIGSIVILLAGAFPMVFFISKVFTSPLQFIGSKLGINNTSTAGLIASMAHLIPMLSIVKEMNNRGKVINVAFSVSGASVLGAHLGFVAGIEKELVFALIIAKFISGFSAITLAIIVERNN